MSPLVMAAIVGGAAFLFVAWRRGQSQPAPAQSFRPVGSVIDLDAIDALAKRKAAELISDRIVANAAAKHVAEHSAASAPPPAPAVPKE